jgi:hypothetical protein
MTEPVSSPSQNPVATNVAKRPRALRNSLAALVLVSLLIWASNLLLVGLPVSAELGSDARNEGYGLSAHYRYYVDPTTLVLNLRRVDRAAPIDLFRGLMQAAKALHEKGRSFSKVILSRAGSPVFTMDGTAFSELGVEVAAGQNPIYLIRTLPGNLHLPDGTPAFGSWSGGWLGVMTRQMEDANKFAQQWMEGR